MGRRVAIVPHTHWDREWYSPFAAFRLRLVELLDELLPRLEAEPAYARFLLDGQMAVVDDYLAVRPEAAGALRRLASAGRLSVGPWYVLMDEFCVSGETIVRDLQAGLDRATGLGGAMEVGYLPDMFGHIAQMPQLLAAAGLRHAVVWRGVPSPVDRHAFWWKSPDGSSVRAEYLPTGYSNGAATPTDAGDLVRRIAAHEEEVSSFLDDGALLWMNGTDHQLPQPWLPAVVAEANQMQKDYHLEVTSLAEYLAGAPTEGLPGWEGELRSGARANLLMGVLSNRVDVKVAAAVAERALERRAEPLAALWLDDGPWREVLAGAWRQVVANAAHDSICACSADAVVVAVLDRFADATAAADAVAARALAAVGPAVGGEGPVVVNPSARQRAGVVELVLAGEEAPPGTQLLDRVSAGSETRRGSGGDLSRLLGELVADGWLPPTGSPTSAAVEHRDGVLHVELGVDRRCLSAHPEVGPNVAEAWAQAGAGRQQPLEVTVTRPASVRVAARVEDVPGYGWTRWRSGGAATAGPGREDSDTARAASEAASAGSGRAGAGRASVGRASVGRASVGRASVGSEGGGSVRVGDGWLDNGRVRVEVDAVRGTLTVNGITGFDRLVDGGDEGDTYNYSPPAGDVVVYGPLSFHARAIEEGPVRGRLSLRRRYQWPSRVVDGRRTGAEDVEVTTDVEIRTGEDLVRFTTSFDNRCRDHRLRTLMPLPGPASGGPPATHSLAECAFATVTRGLEAEGGPHERGLATFPSRRFVCAGGLTVTHEGLLEYEVVNGGTALALTLLRATGFLSRPAPAWRPNAAGPYLPLHGPQMLGPFRVRYAVALTDTDPYALADDAWLPLEVVEAGEGAGPGADSGSGHLLSVSGAEVSALRRVDGGLELRVFNPSPAETTVTTTGRHGWLVDLRGRLLEPFEGSFPLRPWGIATAFLAG
jgi:mannosylglycerate hydrolase